jgi:hypothetical protein
VVNVVVSFGGDGSEFVCFFLDDLWEVLGRGDSDDDGTVDNDAKEDDGASPSPSPSPCRSVRGILRGGCPPGCSRDENEPDVFEFEFEFEFELGRLSFKEEADVFV